MKKYKKPPLGVKPRFIWEEERIEALQDAMKRHIENGFMVPVEWAQEHNELITKRNENIEKIIGRQKGGE